MLKKVLLFASLFGILLASCRQEDGDRLAHDAATSEGSGVEVLLDSCLTLEPSSSVIPL